MTDKKKLDEAVTLTMNGGVDEQGVTVASTVTANDMVELAMILKRAGITSAMYEGPASISDDGADGISTTINAPNLRAIMTMMEPVFQAAGDMEAGVGDMAQDMEVPAEEPCVDGACDAVEVPVDSVAEIEPEVDMGMDLEEPVAEDTLVENEEDDVFDILDYACELVAAGAQEGSEEFDLGDNLAYIYFVAAPFDENNYSADNSVIDGLMAKYGVEEPYQSGVWNDTIGRNVAVHYIIDAPELEESTQMQPYPGIADKKPVQPKTKQVPARSGDNPLAEASGDTGSFRTWINTPFDMSSTDELEVTVHYHYDSGDFDTGLDSPSVANGGSTMTIEEVLTDGGEDILNHLSGSQLEGLEQEAIDYVNERSVPEAAAPKSFKDYFREAAERNVEEEAELEEAVTAESLISELGRYGSKNWAAERDRKDQQFGPPFFLNTDCGYASLNDIGTHDYFGHDGVVILAINRSGKWGLNYVAGSDSTAPGTKVTCVTQTSTGQKYREGKVVDSFTMDEYQNDRAGLEARLAKHGITPTKKLSVKTFD